MGTTSQRYSANGLTLIAIAIFWVTLTLITLLSFVPFNPLSTSYKTKVQTLSLIPQGWGFFTRNPREPQISAYTRIGKKWVLQTFPNATYALGASRKMRVQSGELEMILRPVDDKSWKDDLGSIETLISSNMITLYNPRNQPLMCGEYLVVSKAPIPWAWSRAQTMTQYPYRYLHIYVICKS